MLWCYCTRVERFSPNSTVFLFVFCLCLLADISLARDSESRCLESMRKLQSQLSAAEETIRRYEICGDEEGKQINGKARQGTQHN